VIIGMERLGTKGMPFRRTNAGSLERVRIS